MIHILVLLIVLFANLITHPIVKYPKQDTIKSNRSVLKHMQIISSAFANNKTLPKKYTCQGDGINPPLSFKDVPASTRSLALIVEDPDAISGLFVHWVVFNIPPDIKEIAENSFPLGSVQSITGYGKEGYGSPCPPPGTGIHRYNFKLYALDIVLVLTPNVLASDVENAMRGHILVSSQLTGLYPEK